ncbi:acyl-CoA thioesterase [Sphingomonas crocodyli]|uniref:Acyl-CoA thioesterase 2 n=1 Tax=Sphingomonas crocodyli TaxID=1979270 RepID=A0A437M4M5_9SPHN|nr:acyl-CoA thioesterase II [Sphingomonas crocodyli]RVT92670.1 acyl-CoA thioesterase II [Sphingomonas crocodyli]
MNELIGALTMNAVGPDLFEGRTTNDGWFTLFGGQVIAQALSAATLTVPADRPVHSLHAYFLRGGAFDTPIKVEVARDRDGGAFSSRRVVVHQNDKPILTMMASFHAPEPGSWRQPEMPDVPPPEALPSLEDVQRAAAEQAPESMRESMLRRITSIDVHPITGCQPFQREDGPAEQAMWFRCRDVPADQSWHRILLAYASDLFLVNACIGPHRSRLKKGAHVASLDHGLWIHQDVNIEDWLLYVSDSASAGQGRGMNRGHIFSRDGRLIATTTQEGLMRLPA